MQATVLDCATFYMKFMMYELNQAAFTGRMCEIAITSATVARSQSATKLAEDSLISETYQTTDLPFDQLVNYNHAFVCLLLIIDHQHQVVKITGSKLEN